MKKINPMLKNFVKGSTIPDLRTGKNSVIYTRVSSKEQADNNTSLASQKRYCEEYCQKHGYTIKSYFGGTYESAKEDERKEFKKMLEYVRKNKNIDTILVYSYDRFSRSGTNAAYLIEELQKAGVKLIAVSQEIDTSTPAGRLQRNVINIFSQFDNDLRRDKVINGMVETLRQGYWVAAPPFGYTNLNRKEKARNHKYEINKDGEHLREGFKLKAEGRLTNKEIVAKLRRKGCTIHYKSFVRIISNPFYCGYITHSLIPGEIYRGYHPALISEELFFAANCVISGEPRSGIPKQFKIVDLSLKIFAKAEASDSSGTSGRYDSSGNSESPFTGYMKKGIYYYKSRQKGTAINVNAKHLNGLFSDELRKYEYDKKHSRKLREGISRIINEEVKNYLQEQTQSKKQLSELIIKMERLEERFIEGQITKELFEKYQSKFKAEKEALDQKLTTPHLDSSNLEKIINKGMSIAENLNTRWLSGSFDDKQKLQSLVFPEGILYNKKKDAVRTLRVNSLFAPIPQLVSFLNGNEKSHSVKNGSKSHLVVPTGIEPVSKV
jgi:site-specific DNA recombinase